LKKTTISLFKKRKYVKRSKIGNRDVQNYKKRRCIYLITGLRVEVLSPKTLRYKNILLIMVSNFFFYCNINYVTI
ncbi:unnamed protein product, partial [marine sediment metagenome]